MLAYNIMKVMVLKVFLENKSEKPGVDLCLVLFTLILPNPL